MLSRPRRSTRPGITGGWWPLLCLVSAACAFDPQVPAGILTICRVNDDCRAGEVCTPRPDKGNLSVCCPQGGCSFDHADASPIADRAVETALADGASAGISGAADALVRIDPTFGAGADGGPESVNSDAPSDAAEVPDAPRIEAGPAGTALGRKCSLDLDCESRLCVDGVCCSSACSGGCQSCNQTGREGSCLVRTGRPRSGRCPGGPGPCAGTCDGTGDDCTYPGETTECAPASCTAGVASLRAGCNGDGACLPEKTMSCAPNVCDHTGCAGGCAVNVHCAAGNFCESGRCFPQVKNGAACGTDQQCASEHCVEGVCCDTSCNGLCQTCKVSDHLGTCTIATGRVCRAAAGDCDAVEICDDTNPGCPADRLMASGSVCRSERGPCDAAESCDGVSSTCPADGFRPSSASCGAPLDECHTTPLCSGTSGVCPTSVLKAADSPCGGVGRCMGNSFVPPGSCSSLGVCLPSAPTSCGRFACEASGCRSSCIAPAVGCDLPFYCDGTTCVDKKLTGQACRFEYECENALCMTFYRDADDDRYGRDPASFCGFRAPTGYTTQGGDCCDGDQNTHPGQQLFFTAQNACQSFDYNCDGNSERGPTSTLGSCVAPACAEQGYVSTPPACGHPADFITCVPRLVGANVACFSNFSQRVEDCR
jgi:hypothetical protein